MGDGAMRGGARRRLSWAVALLAARGEEWPSSMEAALDSITTEDAYAVAEYLTSADCAGRYTGQPGLERATAFLEKAYASLGLEGAVDGAFRQPFPVPVLSYAPEDFVVVQREGAPDARFQVGKDFVPVRRSPSGEAAGDVVFCGYGIQNSKEKYDDFRGADVRGRVVAVLSHEPRQEQKGRAFEGLEFTEDAAIDAKARAAQELGAVAVLVFTNPLCHENRTVLESEFPRFEMDNRSGRRPEVRIPLVHCSDAVADALFGPGVLEEWQKEIDSALRGKPRVLEGARVELRVTLAPTELTTFNVAAVRRGQDPVLREEWIILGAHYDHEGVDSLGRRYPGADDNASGTACLLEIAGALAHPELPLRRSVLFLSFSGEEKGLLGARAYCENPLVPLERTVAMINMDMVGRGPATEIDAAGLSYSKDFERLARRAVSLTRTRLRVDKDGLSLFERSDQHEFWKRGVPVLFFTEASSEYHGDYHQVTDTLEKLVLDKIGKVARVVTGMTYLLCVEEEWPDGTTGIPEGGARRARVLGR